jgi:hypothetical protein
MVDGSSQGRGSSPAMRQLRTLPAAGAIDRGGQRHPPTLVIRDMLGTTFRTANAINGLRGQMAVVISVLQRRRPNPMTEWRDRRRRRGRRGSIVGGSVGIIQASAHRLP